VSVRRTVLPSGLRIVTEEISSVRSAAIGIWVNVGSRDETPAVAGASHFLEHLLFKGTKTRTALDISSSIESVGGEMNAFTSKEYTCFYARVIDTDLPMAIDVISDLITSSKVTALDVDAERKVVLEEIAMLEDDPSDQVHELFAQTYYGDTQLGRPILGTVQSIKTMPRRNVFNYYKKRYVPQDLVVAVAGNIEHGKVVAMVKKALAQDDFLDVTGKPQVRADTQIHLREHHPVGLLHRKTEQAHMFYGMAGVARNDDRRFTMGVLAAALGGGMSSRLFQEIREKRGLAYSVYSYSEQFAGSGILGFYAGSHPTKALEVVEIIREVLADVAANGMTHDEIARAKGAVKGSLVLSQEDSGSRMSRIGKNEIVYGEIMDFDDILKEISAVSADGIRKLAGQILIQRPTLALVGPFKDGKKFEKVLGA
jgi:predicted Zn-dependent peptidase